MGGRHKKQVNASGSDAEADYSDSEGDVDADADADADANSNEEEYVVEKVLKKRIVRGKVYSFDFGGNGKCRISPTSILEVISTTKAF